MIIYQNVSQLTGVIKNLLENDEQLTFFKVSGEISNYTHHSSNHRYFTLKDKKSQISVVMFSMYASKLNFEPKNGDHITVTGQINLYEPHGSYSIRALSLEKIGLGALHEQYLKLKDDLEKLGYFDQSLKKTIPKFPKAIGLVTSKTGAVFHDVSTTLEKRYKIAPLILYQSLVQGPEASLSIASQINKANQEKLVDVLIVGRGGGSIEDLWAFNEMPTIEAILNSKIPIITAIGHETDTTISDFVADLRAATPTAAAVFASSNLDEVMLNIISTKQHLNRLYKNYLNDKQMRLMHLSEQLNLLSPLNKVKRDSDKVKQLTQLLNKNFQLQFEKKKTNVNLLVSRLKSPKDKLKNYNDQFNLLLNKIKVNYNNVTNHKHNNINSLMLQLPPLYKNILTIKKTSLANVISRLNHVNPLAKIEAGFGLIKVNDHIISSDVIVKKGDLLDIEIKDRNLKALVTQVDYKK